uniref:C2H2-type domain-containing protein n=1 Tax=Strigamia maritima TaxID=126957 RepID=T1JMY8_STRMM
MERGIGCSKMRSFSEFHVVQIQKFNNFSKKMKRPLRKGQPYDCNLCDYSCFGVYRLQQHMLLHTGENRSNAACVRIHPD